MKTPRKLVRILPSLTFLWYKQWWLLQRLQYPPCLPLPCDVVDTREGYTLHQSFNYGKTGLQQKPEATRIYYQRKTYPKAENHLGVEYKCHPYYCTGVFIWIVIVFVSALVTDFHSFKQSSFNPIFFHSCQFQCMNFCRIRGFSETYISHQV